MSRTPTATPEQTPEQLLRHLAVSRLRRLRTDGYRDHLVKTAGVEAARANAIIDEVWGPPKISTNQPVARPAPQRITPRTLAQHIQRQPPPVAQPAPDDDDDDRTAGLERRIEELQQQLQDRNARNSDNIVETLIKTLADAGHKLTMSNVDSVPYLHTPDGYAVRCDRRGERGRARFWRIVEDDPVAFRAVKERRDHNWIYAVAEAECDFTTSDQYTLDRVLEVLDSAPFQYYQMHEIANLTETKRRHDNWRTVSPALQGLIRAATTIRKWPKCRYPDGDRRHGYQNPNATIGGPYRDTTPIQLVPKAAG